MKIIAIEEHFHTEDFLEYLRSRKVNPRRELIEDKAQHRTSEKLWSASVSYNVRSDPELDRKIHTDVAYRLAEMDKARIDMQVLSLATPGVEAFDSADGIFWARQTNDELAVLIKQHPRRFAGLAALPVQEPKAAVNELERAVKHLGLKGALINSHTKGEYLDDKKYWAIFERAEKLDVPIYLHPGVPSTAILKPYADYGVALTHYAFGADVSLHSLRLIHSGLFDKYPKLNFILGHMGEGLPFWLTRMDAYFIKPWKGKKPRIAKKPSDYVKANFTVTISGMFFYPALLCTLLGMGADHIAFGVDYPYEKNEQAVNFIQEAPISESDREKICYGNAARLLKLT